MPRGKIAVTEVVQLPIIGGHHHGHSHPDGPYLRLDTAWMDEDWAASRMRQ